MTRHPTEGTKFILLQGIQCRNKFFSTYLPHEDQRKMANGEIAYDILGYATSIEDAQRALYGRACV